METTAQPDHAYTNTLNETINPTEFYYKMSIKDTENLVKLRVSNSHLFNGMKYSSKWAWRTILKHMGLHHKMTHRQASKKFENLKKRYKDLKYPPEGVRTVPGSWPFFSLMEDAMEGRLKGSAPILSTLPFNSNNSDFLQVPSPKRRKVSDFGLTSAIELGAGGAEIEILLNGDEDETAVAELEESEELNDFIQEVNISMDSEQHESKRKQPVIQREKKAQDVAALDQERALLERERAVMEREKTMLERERAVMEREKTTTERERVLLERERAVMERERAVMERERAVMEREKTMLEKDREALRSERLALEKEKAKWERVFAQKERSEVVEEDNSKRVNCEAGDRKE